MTGSALTRDLHLLARTPSVALACAGLALSLTALLIAFLVVWMPARADHRAALARTDALTETLRTARALDRMADAYHARRTELDALETRLADAGGNPKFVASLETLAAASGVELLQFSSRAARSSDTRPSGATVFEFHIGGRYPEIKAMLAGIRALPELVTVQRVAVEEGPNGLRARILLERRRLESLTERVS